MRPASDVRTWGVEESERWRKARAPLFFAPAAGSWLLGVLVTVSLVLILGDEGPAQPVGTQWRAYPAAVLLVALPLWYRFVPAAAAVSAAVLVVASAASLTGGAGYVLVFLGSLWALAGALLRLRARRRQERLALTAAGPARFPLPARLPSGHERRGNTRIIIGALLCLFAVGILVDGLVEDLGVSAGELPYDAVGQQRWALVLLVLGSTLLGWGWTADRAVRRLYEEDQPAFVVGVRISPSGHHWLLPDADDTAGRPLIPFRPGRQDAIPWARLLARGADGPPLPGQHDIDARAEPFEAVLYGAPCEGAEAVLECAVNDGHSIASRVTAAPLLPRRHHRLGRWSPAGVSYRESSEGWRVHAEARRREQERARQQSARTSKRATATGTAGTTAAGCGGGGGGGCGGDGGGGCGGCGCG
ncbi:hypothetical protein [Streptomyces sp. NBC_00091]|uniref:hypothetical protein n=1 Tax=Streptomyces sp. NBC_00091 TaxID=2975648 RepID=UPI0022514B07|nr:hypothetical protein [Streptomyces sp. NBC_00091]MCX5379880.1 hypothetical protein [Streptomyces sp. NBC_00091]